MKSEYIDVLIIGTGPAFGGYVWDHDNPYVKNHDVILNRLAKMIQFRDKQALL